MLENIKCLKLTPSMSDKSNVSVLVVEDDVIIAHDISLLLKRAGYKIAAVCHNASKALDKLSKGGIDFALLDIHLGSGDSGIDIAEKIHTIYKIPYIFLTSFSDELTLQAAREQGPYGYLVKPFQEPTLLSTISIALSNHQMQSKDLNFTNLEIDLTDKERTLCRELYKGHSYNQIAETMHVSINTVRYHVKNLYLKFDVNSRAGLVATLLA